MKQLEYRWKDYRLLCRECPEGIGIQSVRGSGSQLEVPAQIEWEGKQRPVVLIEKKACLGCRGLRQVILPETVCRIEDWAFAQCGQLEMVELGFPLAQLWQQDNGSLFGVGVFEGCPRLTEISFVDEDTPALGVLLAAAIGALKAEDLLQDAQVGTEHWYQKWDQRLRAFLEEEDKEGYTNMVLCGEEDIQQDLDTYVSERQKRKAELCMLRLMQNTRLGMADRECMEAYLVSHTKGCPSEAAWEVVVSRHGDQLEYYQLLEQIHCIHEGNIDAMMLDLQNQHAEAKAYLIRCKQSLQKVEDVFDQFTLQW